MNFAIVKVRFDAAIEAFRENDAQLLELGVSERTIAARLQVYLVSLFPSHHVDVEYNRHGVDVKRLSRSRDCGNDDITSRILPDIVIHKRGDDKANLLVVEIKDDSAGSAQVDRDREKLAKLRRQYCYQHTLLLQIPRGQTSAGRDWLLEWDGRQ